MLDALTERRAQGARAQTRLEAARDALATVGEDEPSADPLLDFYGRLAAELDGHVKGAAGDVKRLNVILREYFDAVALAPTDGGVLVTPRLAWEAVERIATGEIAPPRMEYVAKSLRPPTVVATGGERITPPLRAIRASENAQPPW